MRELVIVNEIPEHDLEYIKYLLEEHGFKQELKEVGSGAFGTVYRYKNYAIKVYEDEEDGEILHKLQGLDYYLKLFCYMPDEIMVTEFLDNYKPVHLFNKDVFNISKEEIENIFHETYKRDLSPRDLHGNNIMFNIHTGKFKIVDVGKFRQYVRFKGGIKYNYENLEDVINYDQDKFEFELIQKNLGLVKEVEKKSIKNAMNKMWVDIRNMNDMIINAKTSNAIKASLNLNLNSIGLVRKERVMEKVKLPSNPLEELIHLRKNNNHFAGQILKPDNKKFFKDNKKIKL